MHSGKLRSLVIVTAEQVESEKGPQVGAIVGGIIGGLLGLAIILLLIFIFVHRSHRKISFKQMDEMESQPSPTSTTAIQITNPLYEKTNLQETDIPIEGLQVPKDDIPICSDTADPTVVS